MNEGVLVRGVGDVGSAVAHGLFRNGFAVLLHDSSAPPYARRGMAFTDAMFDGRSELEGVLAKRSPDSAHTAAMLGCGKAIPVSNASLPDLLAATGPVALVDARMRKRVQPENQRELAALTIGLGPNFLAGTTVHLVIETAWGEELGQVIERGGARALEGEPARIGGHGRERFVYARHAGVFTSALTIGQAVEAGQVVAAIDASALRAPLSGRLRGLTRSGVSVEAGMKVVEIDPRSQDSAVFGLGERPRRIAQGVLNALQRSR